MQEHAEVNYDQNHTSSSIIILEPQGYYDTGENYNITENMWWAYSESGIFAGLELHASGVYEAYDDEDLLEEGTIEFTIDIRIVNPNYNPLPPEDVPTNKFPGFTLMIAIPVIISIGIGIAVYRKKRQ